MDPVVNSKGEKDERFESNKEIKHDWGSQNESKGGDYGKGVREHHNSNSNRGGGGYVDNWRSTSLPPPGPIVVVEVGKDTEVHEVVVGGKENKIDYSEVHEAVGENKVEDKFKDKDRKPRKDAKHHRDAAGERDKERCDRNLQDGISSEDNNNREAEKEGTINDLSKPKLKENDPSSTATCKVVEKLEKLVVVEKEGEKDLVDGSIGMLERENLALDHQTQIDFDGGWKKNDAGDRRKERDVVDFVDGERPDKRTRYCDKDSDDGCADVEEKEKDILFNYGVQQRKRMLRPRGSPQLGNRDPRVKSENDGSQGKTEVSAVVYKVGECMQELIKLWKDYESSETDKNGESSQSGPTLEIRIPAEYVTATNRQVRGGQLWGTDIYTDDSDLVAVLMHTGYCRPTASPPPPAIQELGATIRVLPPQDCYVSTLRNNVRSRAWGAAIGCSYLVERCCIVKKGGGTIDLEPCLTHTSTVEPTLAPVAVERTMTTRAAASNALRQQRFVREVTIQYNLCNEPWIKYSISIVADKGLKKPLYTSARLKKGEVLYLETHSQSMPLYVKPQPERGAIIRYELCFTGEKMIRSAASSQVHEAEIEKSQNHQLQHANGERSSTDSDNVIIDAFRWSRSKKLLPQKLMRSVGIPLPIEYVEVLEENLDWEDIQWSQTGVCIARKEYALARVHFLSLN